MISPIPLASFLITLLLASAVSIHGVQINDTDGNPVKVNEKYYIQPVNGGSLFPGGISSIPSCSPNVLQIIVNYPGDPVSFTVERPLPATTIVTTDSEVTIEFAVLEGCDKITKYWGFDDSPSAPKEPVIYVGADPERINSWFMIRTAGENTYELANGKRTVGIIRKPHDNVVGQLSLTNDTTKTVLVKFIKKHNVDANMGTRVEKLRQRMFPLY